MLRKVMEVRGAYTDKMLCSHFQREAPSIS
jgi:hypothetical protein